MTSFANSRRVPSFEEYLSGWKRHLRHFVSFLNCLEGMPPDLRSRMRPLIRPSQSTSSYTQYVAFGDYKQVVIREMLHLRFDVNTFFLVSYFCKFLDHIITACIHQRHHLFHFQSTESWCQGIANTFPILLLCCSQHAVQRFRLFHKLLMTRNSNFIK